MPRHPAVPLLIVACVLSLGAGPLATAEERHEERGYLALEDGTLLHYAVRRPAGDGPFPTVVTYAGYGNGFTPGDVYWVDAGYARVNVTVRGAGCSGGTWDLFSPQQARDGVETLRWVDEQSWSAGIALGGESYGAIMALLVAEEPEVEQHLDAVIAAHPMADLYRDVLYPGGIPNITVPVAFTGFQNWFSTEDAAAGLDETCAAHFADRPPGAANQAPLFAASHPFDDAAMRERSPAERLADIDVPVFVAVAWQDDTLGSRPVDLLSRLDVPYRAIVGNGHHQLWYDAFPAVRAFLDLHLRGIGEPPASPITVWWEKADGPPPLRGPVAWETSLGAWPPPQARELRLSLDAGGRLTRGAGGGDVDRYLAGVPGQSQTTEHTVTGILGAPATGYNAWSTAPPDGSAVAYTTEPFRRDLTVLGSASVDLWLSSTAPDTDVQVTLTEVRPNGEEVYVQQGWLRASHRALDPERSTATRPFHTHRREDAALLVPGEVTPLRIEVLPFGHVFRAGSRLRLWVESPKATPDLWATVPGPTAVNAVHHDAEHPSALVLATVPGRRAEAPAPPCDAPALRQPCR